MLEDPISPQDFEDPISPQDQFGGRDAIRLDMSRVLDTRPVPTSVVLDET
jgi:hypothetical protein